MSTKRFLLAATAGFTMFLTSCINNDYYNTEPQPNNPPVQVPQYNYVFDENFDNNINNWAFNDPNNSAYVRIQNSVLKYTYLPVNDGTNTVAIDTDAPLHSNFLIQTRMKTDYAMGIAFGVSPADYGYSFFIDNEGYFAVYKEGNEVTPVSTLLDWQYSDAINPEGWNDVEFEQYGNYWAGYVNGVKLFEIPAKYIGGTQIGYIVLAGTTGYADFLTVQW